MAGLELLHVSKRFGQKIALSDVSLHVKPEEWVSIVGPSGCGKTTLLRIVAGLEEADQGVIRLDGKVIDQYPPRDRQLAMVFQGESVYPHLSVFENLAFPLRMRGTPRAGIRPVVEATADRLGVADLLTRMPNTLSGGERQRVAIGRALVRDPHVLLLDEPFAHLDLPLRRQLGQELSVLRQHWRASTLFVTHDHQEALELADRVAVIHDGAIQQFAAPQQIREEPANRFVADFFSSPR